MGELFLYIGFVPVAVPGNSAIGSGDKLFPALLLSVQLPVIEAYANSLEKDPRQLSVEQEIQLARVHPPFYKQGFFFLR